MWQGSKLCFLQPSPACCDSWEEEHWVLWAHECWLLQGIRTMNVVRIVCYPSSFTQTNTLWNVFFSHQMNKYDVLGFFLSIPLSLLTILAPCASKLFVWCDLWISKLANMMFWELFWKTSMLPYNSNSFMFIWMFASNFCLLANSMCSLWLGLRLRKIVDVTWFFAGINDSNISAFGRRRRWGRGC